MIPVYVHNLMDSSTKLLDEVLINRIIHEAIPDLDPSVKKVIVYYVDIIDKAEIERFIKDDDSTLVEIELRDLKEILDDVVVEDYVEFDCNQTNGKFVVSINKFVSDRVNQKIDEFNQKSLANSNDKKPYKPIVISDEGLELIEMLSLDCTATDGEILRINSPGGAVTATQEVGDEIKKIRAKGKLVVTSMGDIAAKKRR